MTTPTIPPARLPAAEVVVPSAPPRNPDDFGFFIGLGIACPLGALCWWLIAQAAQFL